MLHLQGTRCFLLRAQSRRGGVSPPADFVRSKTGGETPPLHHFFILSTRHLQSKTPSFSDSRVLVATRARSRSDTTPWCHSLRSRRFATPVPTLNGDYTPFISGMSFVFGASRRRPLRFNIHNTPPRCGTSFAFSCGRRGTVGDGG